MTRTSFSFKKIVLGGLFAGMAAVSMAQPAAVATPAGPAAAPQQHAQGERHRPDPAKMQARMAERQAALKAKLQITPAQEPAWASFADSMKPPARPQHPDREAMRKATTPERITQMRAHHAAHAAEMERRADATLKLYAALTPAQQQVFDAKSAMGHHAHGQRGHRGAPAKG